MPDTKKKMSKRIESALYNGLREYPFYPSYLDVARILRRKGQRGFIIDIEGTVYQVNVSPTRQPSKTS